MKKIFALILSIFMIATFPLNSFAKTYSNESSKGKDLDFLIKYKDQDQKANIEKEILKKGKKIEKEYKKSKLIKAKLSKEEVVELKQSGYVEFIEQDFQVEALEEITPWGVNKVNAPISFKSNITGQGVKVAVFDTGISNHLDLQIKGGVSFTENNNNYTDDNGHGTHVAGIIAASLNNKGIVGVAPNVDLYSVKVLNSSGVGNYSSIIEGIEWAIENEIKIINMSFGSTNYSQILEEAINLAHENGILIIGSAGNNGKDNNNSLVYPAKFENVISVGATDEKNARAAFSSIGPELDLVAPGVNINSTLNHDNYGIKNGTSMAAPHVAGVAALLWSKNLNVTSDTIKGLLYYSATNLGDQSFYGNGLINAGYALDIYDEYIKDYSDVPGKPKKKLKPRLVNKKKNGNKEEDLVSINGTEESYVIQSPNPYANNYNNTWRISKSGATGLRVYFEYINTEANYDVIELSNGQSFTGTYNGVWSNWVTGSYVDLTFRTDGSVTNQGFKVSKIEYLLPTGQVESYSLTSPNPYPNSYSNSWSINKTGASKIRVHFSYIDTEPNYDFVTTSAGDRFHGSLSNVWSSWMNSNSISVSLTSDSSIQYNGFKIDKIEYINNGVTDDYGNILNEGYTVGLNSLINGNINYAGDVDVFKFTPPSSGKYTFESTGSTDTFGELYDSMGNLINSNDDAKAPNFAMEYNLKANEMYYIKVRHYSSTQTGAYGFLITVSDDHGNSEAQATTINLATPLNGAIDYAGDVDYFKFIPVVTSNYTFESSGSTDTYGHLYNTSGQELASNDDDGDGANFSMKYSLSANQTYYIKVRHYNSSSTGAYGISVTQDDHGNNFDTATYISTGIDVSGNIEKINDTDYFRFTIGSGGTYVIETSGNTDTYGELYDINRNLIETNDDGKSSNLRFVKGLTSNQTYYLQVKYANNEGTGQYNLKVYYFPDDHSNSFENVATVQTGNTNYASLNYEEDIDLFKFTPSTTGIYSIKTQSNLDMYAELFDQNLANIEYSDDKSDTDTSVNIIVRLEANSTYYLLLSNSEGEETLNPTGSYTFQVTYTGDDHSNSSMLATPIINGQTLEGSIETEGDEDYFVFTPNISGNYSIESLGDIDTVGELRDLNNQLITSNDDYNSLNFKMTTYLNANTQYYIKVNHYISFAKGNYQLKVNLLN